MAGDGRPKKSCSDINNIEAPVFEAPCPQVRSEDSVPVWKKIRSKNSLPPESGYPLEGEPSVEVVDSKKFGEYRTEDLVAQNYFGWTTKVFAYPNQDCQTFVNTVTSRRQMCTAVVRARIGGAYDGDPQGAQPIQSYKMIRFDKDPKYGGRFKSGHIMPTGFFREVSQLKGRTRLIEKAGPFFTYLSIIERHMMSILSQKGHKKGDDLIGNCLYHACNM
jgi:hypothetical protein